MASTTTVPREQRPSTTFDWRSHLAVHPAADLFPLMAEAELKELAEDVKKNALQNPILFLVSPSDVGHEPLIDGRNRLDALALADHLAVNNQGRLCIKLPNGELRDIKKQYLVGDPYELVLSLNVHRRHLTAEQKRDLIAKLVKAKPELSDRQLGKMAKASKNTAASVRTDLEARGQIDHVEKREDSKGRKQPAKKSKSAPKKIAKSKSGLDIAGAIDTFITKCTVEDGAAASAAERKAAYANDDKPNGASTTALARFKGAVTTYFPLLTDDDRTTARKFVLSDDWRRGAVS